jgi:hypothetical protein
MEASAKKFPVFLWIGIVALCLAVLWNFEVSS